MLPWPVYWRSPSSPAVWNGSGESQRPEFSSERRRCILSMDTKAAMPPSNSTLPSTEASEDVVTPRWPPHSCVLSVLSAEGWFDSAVQNTFIHAKLPPPTPVDARHRSHSVPKDAGSRRAESSQVPDSWVSSERQRDDEQATALVSEGTHQDEIGLGVRRRLHFCPVQPLTLEGAEAAEEPLRLPETLEAEATSRWLGQSPTSSRLRLTVRNTFIHSAPAPPTPVPGCGHRSKSMPPEAGSITEASGSALSALPELLQGKEGRCISGRSPCGVKSVGADSLPAFVPLSPDLMMALRGYSESWLGTKPAISTAQRSVRFANS